MYPILMLHFSHHKRAFQWSQAINRPQHIQNKLLIVFHIGSMNLQQVIITSWYVITFGYFRNILYNPCKLGCYIPVQTSKLHTAEYDKSLIQLFRIQHGNILLYISSTLQPFKTFKNRSWRKAHPCSQLFVVNRAFSCKVRSICKSTLSSLSKVSIRKIFF